MAKALVTYFSASGVTAAVASRLAKAIEADIFEIKSKVPYSSADLNYVNPLAICCIIKIPKVADKNGESCISILEKIAG